MYRDYDVNLIPRAYCVIVGLEHPEHFSRSENDGAIYQNDVNGRLSVLVPFKSLQGICLYTCYAMLFTNLCL